MLRNLIKEIKSRGVSQNSSPHFFDDDVFLVSYPKSGNTWLRFLLANYITGGRVDLLQSNLIIPDVHYNPQDITKTLNPRIIKSHEPFTPKYKRAVYILRDGRDVAVSYFFYLKKFNILPDNITFSDYLDSFIGGKLDSFGGWGEHVAGWLDGAESLLLIRYEDLHSNAANVLESVVRYCGLEYDEKKIIDSVSACSLSELRQIEIKQFNDIKILSTSDPATYFFRKGVVGEWRNHFNENDEEKFFSAFSKTMTSVKYE